MGLKAESWVCAAICGSKPLKMASIGWLQPLFQVGSSSNCSGCRFGFALWRLTGRKWCDNVTIMATKTFISPARYLQLWHEYWVALLSSFGTFLSSFLVLSPPPSQCLPGLKRESKVMQEKKNILPLRLRLALRASLNYLANIYSTGNNNGDKHILGNPSILRLQDRWQRLDRPAILVIAKFSGGKKD